MTTEAQIESFIASKDSSEAERRVLRTFLRVQPQGLTVDEAFTVTYPGKPHSHSAVDTFRVVIRRLRELGYLRDSGAMRNGSSQRRQAVWMLGDDRDVVLAHREVKLRKLADELGYDLISRKTPGGQ